ncbi:hypothetical protein MGSAQ_001573 [marine sediment metagenome]|uniref:Uncharacterized protein n=1 Tax=marine sediment metagenome TaxID=412755 RepID=A0A1B6NUD8_9ZZZZ
MTFSGQRWTHMCWCRRRRPVGWRARNKARRLSCSIIAPIRPRKTT